MHAENILERIYQQKSTRTGEYNDKNLTLNLGYIVRNKDCYKDSTNRFN